MKRRGRTPVLAIDARPAQVVARRRGWLGGVRSADNARRLAAQRSSPEALAKQPEKPTNVIFSHRSAPSR